MFWKKKKKPKENKTLLPKIVSRKNHSPQFDLFNPELDNTIDQSSRETHY